MNTETTEFEEKTRNHASQGRTIERLVEGEIRRVFARMA
jgi:hypothetical protein